ncbi:calcineurin subunit B-like [Oscarella lobularis]|uniref:calcineurin subunit B-like n=1 Tax=Oscarella lobularis TaxID=121494 RepID=UPI003313660D
MGAGESSVSEEEIRELGKDTVFTPKEIRSLVRRYLTIDPSGKRGILLQDAFDMSEFCLPRLLHGFVSLYASKPPENEETSIEDRRLHIDQYIRLMSLLSPRTLESDKLQKFFLVCDVDGDGKLSENDLYSTFRMIYGEQSRAVTGEQLNEIIHGLLTTKEGTKRDHLPIEEFIQLIPASEIAEKFTVNVSLQ